ncbi:UDP-N-acetylglucosamine 2-epimerase (non-hydrolyzing) [Gemmatimonas aurantiaca]|nr:UDP-N-acetylglucosamine 2-epimerase (non-hydrolyzing) [Gemmatimonas aurantiaca]
MAKSLRKKAKRSPLVVSIVGARPQFVKLAPLASAYNTLSFNKHFRHKIYHSGQHYNTDMSDVFFSELNIPQPDLNLAVGSGSHGEMTAEMLRAFETKFKQARPAMIIVYGDTNTTLAGTLAAVKMNIPVAHIEAGLRSFDLTMPEEINRRMTDHVSALLFAPTVAAVKNLKKENVPGEIVRSGDLMYELLHNLQPYLEQNLATLNRFGVQSGAFVLFTAHRPATVDACETLERLLALLAELKMPVIFPAHPRTIKSLKRHKLIGSLKKLKHVQVCQPLPYLDNLTLAHHSALVVTDSGGLQKEAVFQGVKCLTMRNETEWPETFRYNNHLIGLSVKSLRAARKAPLVKKTMQWKIGGQPPSEIILQTISDRL